MTRSDAVAARRIALRQAKLRWYTRILQRSVAMFGAEPTGAFLEVIANAVHLDDQSRSKCELCGKVAELRPYGPRGERICINCGMLNLETTERQIDRQLYGRWPKPKPKPQQPQPQPGDTIQ